LVALVGFKRSRLAWFGGIRAFVVRDGIVRILGKRGRVDLEVPVASLTARLTRWRVVELRSGSGSVVVYGFTETTKVPDEVAEIAAREADGAELIGPAPAGALGFYSPKQVTGAAAISRALAEALHARGAAGG
jgi:hypothetical protein